MSQLPEPAANYSNPPVLHDGRSDLVVSQVSPLPHNKSEVLRNLNIIKRRLWLILLITALCVAVGVVVAIRSTKIYSSSATILVNLQQQAKMNIMAAGAGEGNEITTDVALIHSNSVMNYAATYLHDKNLDIPAGQISRVIGVMNVPGTNMIAISAEWPDGATAAAIAEAVAQGFWKYQRDQASLGDTETATFLAREVAQARSNLAAAEDKVQKFKEQSHLAGGGSNGGSSSSSDSPGGSLSNGSVQQLVAIQNDYETALTDRAVLQSQISDVSGKLGQISGQLAAGNNNVIRDNSQVRQLKQQLDAKQSELDAALAQYTPAGVEQFHPGLQQEVAKLKDQLQQETSNLSVGGAVDLDQQQALNTQMFQLQSQLHSLDTRIATLQSRMVPLRRAVARDPALETRLNQILRDRSVMEQIYRTLLERQKQVEISLAGAQGNITVVSDAEVPGAPIRPNPTQDVLLALLLGLGLGCSVAFFLDHIDNTVRSQADITDELGIPLLGAVPIADLTPFEIWKGGGRSLAAEAFRMLRANVSFLSIDVPVRVILVTSAAPAEGKSSTAANLAASVAQDGKRVVVVDCDMRKPSVHRMLGGGRDIGLAEVLSGAATRERALRESDIAGVWTIPVDKIPPNPTELLNSERMRDLIRSLRSEFDLVVLDSPPCLMVADASVLASLADATIQVIAAGKTHRDTVTHARDLLSRAHGRVVGAVLNRFDHRNESSYDYYNYYYYYSQQDEEEHTPKGNGNVWGRLGFGGPKELPSADAKDDEKTRPVRHKP